MTLLRQNDVLEIAEVNRRLKLLMLADKLGSVSEACEQMEFSKTQYYLYKKRYESEGIEGLKPHYHTIIHPMAISHEVHASIRKMSVDHPDFGAQHLSILLKKQGIQVSTAAVHKILIEYNLASRKSRWIFLENLFQVDCNSLTPIQIQFIQKINPSHGEVHKRGFTPGECLVQDCVLIFKDADNKIYLHFTIDTFSNFVIGRIDHSMAPISAMLLLQQEVLPFYQSLNIIPSTIYTHNGRTFAGNKKHDYELLVNKQNIKHIITANGQSHGFGRQFKQIIANELNFMESPKPELGNKSLHLFIRDWLHFYNTRRASIGFPNYSRFPMEVHASGLSEMKP